MKTFFIDTTLYALDCLNCDSNYSCPLYLGDCHSLVLESPIIITPVRPRSKISKKVKLYYCSENLGFEISYFEGKKELVDLCKQYEYPVSKISTTQNFELARIIYYGSMQVELNTIKKDTPFKLKEKIKILTEEEFLKLQEQSINTQ